MNFEQFYGGLLVVEPWFVSRIEFDGEPDDEQVFVHARHRDDAESARRECGVCPVEADWSQVLEYIESVAIDMWEAYVSETKREVPGAENEIVFDRFRVMSYATKAVDSVRRSEHQKLTAGGDRSLTRATTGCAGRPSSRRADSRVCSPFP